MLLFFFEQLVAIFSEESECRGGLVQERISCVNLSNYACQFVDPTFIFRLVPARITIQVRSAQESRNQFVRHYYLWALFCDRQPLHFFALSVGPGENRTAHLNISTPQLIGLGLERVRFFGKWVWDF